MAAPFGRVSDGIALAAVNNTEVYNNGRQVNVDLKDFHDKHRLSRFQYCDGITLVD